MARLRRRGRGRNDPAGRHPRMIHSNGDEVYVFGRTTGSHLQLSDDEELKLPVVWRAVVHDGRLAVWQIVDELDQALIHFNL
jgi:hypothetical protein